MLTPQEAFRVGFLLKCADDGLSGNQVCERIAKTAGMFDSAMSGLGGTANMGMAALAALPIGAGAIGGYLANKATEDSLDEEDVKKRELIDELKHWARRAREQRLTKTLLAPH